MNNRHAFLLSGRTDYVTPDWFLGLVRRVNPIALDPATSVDNPTNAARIITQVLDDELYALSCGLDHPWPIDPSGLRYVNPPYGPHLSGPVEPHYQHWRNDDTELRGIGRGWAERIAMETDETIALVPARTETTWWRRLYGWCDGALLWSSGTYGVRINFVNAETGQVVRGSNLASCVFYRGACVGLDRRLRTSGTFRQVFGPHGTLIK